MARRRPRAGSPGLAGLARSVALAAAVVVGAGAGVLAAPSAPPGCVSSGAMPRADGRRGAALYPQSEIRTGMIGVGKTVLLGTRITEFQVRVLGILRNGGPAGDLVLFRASGAAIRSVGGLAAGMSGSPIYFGGRLAGAFSYSLEGSDPMVGLFTPVADMMRDLPPSAAGAGAPRTTAIPPMEVGGAVVRRVTVAASRSRAPRPAPGTLVAVPAATPLFVSGLGAREQAELAEYLAPMDIVPMAGGSSIDLPASLPLEPGGAIAVALMRGDVGQYAVGTLTYRDRDRILAFGHPFANIGPARYLLTNALILQVVRGMERNIKVGAAGASVGIISEDRPAAIAGMLGSLPRMFGVRVHVTDGETGVSRQFTFQVVPDKELVPKLVTIGAQSAIERALNRSGAGTADVQMTLHARGLDRAIVRDNRFYSGTDIAARALTEMPDAMRLLFDNDFADLQPTDMDMDVRVTNEQETAVITSADVAEHTIAAGSTIHVHVSVRPFRGEVSTRDVDLTVPSTFVPGPAVLVVRAGRAAAPPTTTVGVGAAAAGLTPPPETAHTLLEAVSTFEHQEQQTDLVVELVGGRSAATDTAAGPEAGRPVATATTPWVLAGRVQIPVLVTGEPH